MRYLINTADDFGLSNDINRAIYGCFKDGVLTSTSVLINHLVLDKTYFNNKYEDSAFGLHLNITSGKPLSKVWKTTYKHFYQPIRNAEEKFDLKLWSNEVKRYSSQVIFEEFEKQLEIFEEEFTKTPDHLDTHYNTFQFDNVFNAFIKLAKKWNIPVRQPLHFKGGKSLKSQEVVTDIKKLKIIKKSSLLTTDRFCYEYLNRHDNYFKVIGDEIGMLRDNQSLEIVYHPGNNDDWRRKYTEILLDPKIKNFLDRCDIVLTSFSKLP